MKSLEHVTRNLFFTGKGGFFTGRGGVGKASLAAATAVYLADRGARVLLAGRTLLEEDLRSPCTEEVAVFRAFARMVDRGANGFVVLDTVPLGLADECTFG